MRSSVTPSRVARAGPEPVTDESRFGPYRLLYELANGGMGAVFLARAEGPAGFAKLVALKRIHPHLAKQESFVAMFLDEARIAARIQHPNVCGVMEFGSHAGSYYFTMPFIEGESLHRVLGVVARENIGTPFEPIAIRIVADACEGLHAAHELRDEAGELLEVVHRDVSPHNLMVGYDGGVRVLDFGVASARQRLYTTATGEVKGKFAYIAPEQLRGEPVDRRADIWSLGVVLYESLAQSRLFRRRTMAETVNAVCHDPIPPISEVVPWITPSLERVVETALAREPKDRYATAREMGRALLSCFSEQGELVGAGDVADFIESIFPEGREHAQSLRERAMAATDEETAVAIDGTEPNAPRVTRDAIVATAAPTRPLRSALLLIGAGLVLGAAVVGIGYAILRDATPPAPVSAPHTERTSGDEAVGHEAANEAANEAVNEAANENATDESANEAANESANEAPEDEADGDEAAGDEAEDEPDEPAGDSRGEPRAMGSGTVRIATPGGWAYVYLGRRRVGEAPTTLTLPAGSHTIGIQPFGEGPILRRRVRVEAGGTRALSVAVH